MTDETVDAPKATKRETKATRQAVEDKAQADRRSAAWTAALERELEGYVRSGKTDRADEVRALLGAPKAKKARAK